VQLVHAVAAEVLVERRPASGDRLCVVLAHVEQLACGVVELLLVADAGHLGQFSLDAARVDVAQQAFRRQHLRQTSASVTFKPLARQTSQRQQGYIVTLYVSSTLVH